MPKENIEDFEFKIKISALKDGQEYLLGNQTIPAGMQQRDDGSVVVNNGTIKIHPEQTLETYVRILDLACQMAIRTLQNNIKPQIISNNEQTIH